MKKITILAALLLASLLGSCAAGPQQLSRSVDDWDRELYVNNPRIDGVLYFIPVIPVVKYFAALGDFFVVNPWHFWGDDIWDNEGTNFEHLVVESTDGHVNSLWGDDRQFLFKVEAE